MPHRLSVASLRNRKIGLLGGSFNPAHAGHRAISLYALKSLGLDEIWWLVSPQNPLKPTAGMAPLADRIVRAEQEAHHPRIKVSAIESRFKTHYTVDLLFKLRRSYPTTHFVWLMGADNMQQIPLWKDWQDIFRLMPVAVFRRPTYATGRGRGKAAHRFQRQRLPAKHGKALATHAAPVWLIMNNPLTPLSATSLRKDPRKWPQLKK